MLHHRVDIRYRFYYAEPLGDPVRSVQRVETLMLIRLFIKAAVKACRAVDGDTLQAHGSSEF